MLAPPDLSFFTDQFLVFALVLTRVSGLMVLAPIYGTNETPTQVRVLLALVLALVVFPIQAARLAPPADDLIQFGLLAGGELLVGLLLGLGVNIVFTGLQLAGQVIAQTSGMALGEVFNPALDSSMPLFSQLLHLVAVAVYATIGGHRLLIAAVLETFERVPPGYAIVPETLLETLVTLVSASFYLALAAAAPAIAALLLAALVLGMISRTLPQLNVLSFGFGLNSLVLYGTLLCTLGAMIWVFQDHLELALDTVVGVWAA